jgi:hypothetical protein
MHMPSVIDQARAKIRAAKLEPLESEEAIYCYDVAQKRSFYCEGATSLFDKSFDYFIEVVAKGKRRLGASKLYGHPHLPPGWKRPKGTAWQRAHLYFQLNVGDFKKYDLEDRFPKQGICYVFIDPKTDGLIGHYEPDPGVELVEHAEIPGLGDTDEYLSFVPRFMFHMVDVVDDEPAAKRIPAKLKNELKQLLGATLVERSPVMHIFGRPQFWQGEDETAPKVKSKDKKLPSPSDVLLFHDEYEDGAMHFWADGAALKKGRLVDLKLTASTT